MSYLDDGGKVIDTMFGLPDKVGFQGAYDSMKLSYRDRESRDGAKSEGASVHSPASPASDTATTSSWVMRIDPRYMTAS